MKRVLSIILMLCIVFSMAACSGIKPELPTEPSTEPTEPTEPTVAPTEPVPPKPADIRQEAPFSRENVPEFMALFYKNHPSADKRSYKEIDCYNATPPGVFEETGVQIFAFEFPYKFFLMFDNKLYSADYGVFFQYFISAVPYDCDGDGVKDLVVSYQIAAGGGNTDGIAVFNPVTEKITRPYRQKESHNILAMYITKSEDGSNGPLTVWHVSWSEPGEQIGLGTGSSEHILFYKEYKFTEFAGYLKMVDGSLQFVPHTQ